MGYAIISRYFRNRLYINVLKTVINLHNMLIISIHNKLAGEDEIPHNKYFALHMELNLLVTIFVMNSF